MGVVTVPSSASRTTTGPVQLSRRSGGRPLAVVSFKSEPAAKCSVKSKDPPKKAAAVPQKASPATTTRSRKNQGKGANIEADLDYNEVAAALENLYKLSPGGDVAEVELQGKKGNVVRSRRKGKKGKRLGLRERVAMKGKKIEEDEEEERLVKEYSGWSDLGSLDWRKVKIPPVLRSPEQAKLFKLMQPMKV